MTAAQPSDFGHEFLDLVLAVRIVPSLDAAIAHIAEYGSLHTEVIVTRDEAAARRFLREVCASFVGWNVSTRFNDGGELGLGAEVGISTTNTVVATSVTIIVMDFVLTMIFLPVG